MAQADGGRGNIGGNPSGVTLPPLLPPTPLLRHCFDAAIAAVDAERALARHLAAAPAPEGPVAIISVGKAAPGMATALVEWLATHGQAPVGGMVIAADDGRPVHPSLRSAVGDHPMPGARSFAAADALAECIRALPRTATVHVAISGGASALMASPLPGLMHEDVTSTFAALSAAGLDIDAMNAVRKRITRWSAGRLALALAPRPIRLWLISDVPGDDPGTIGSGPCTGDRWRPPDIAALIERSGLEARLSAPVLTALATVTPRPEDRRLIDIIPVIVANSHLAQLAAQQAAQALGVSARLMTEPLTGEAREMGEAIAAMLLEAAAAGERGVWIWGGETTVATGGVHGVGGRAQELALAAANVLAGARQSITLLAAGTDGRDGPTDAAGAIVAATTRRAIAANGGDPADALAKHDAYSALDLAGALLRTGPSGTNVMDLVIAAIGDDHRE
ncbi:MAG TPA: DUF4147 domain-containing protein [Gemmatimonadales bacterium]|jgi:hydroxypyruvate reductase|nr:DUF4147 domain-containing protein [Gemmatimonadales bacterium]